MVLDEVLSTSLVMVLMDLTWHGMKNPSVEGNFVEGTPHSFISERWAKRCLLMESADFLWL